MVTLPYHEDRMHDDSAPGWRQILERQHATLVAEMTTEVDAEIASVVTREVARALESERAQSAGEKERAVSEAVTEAMSAARVQADEALKTAVAESVETERGRSAATVDAVRRKLSESLNQTLRRIRQTEAEHETLQLLMEDSSALAERVVVLLIENGQATVAAWRGVVLREEAEDGAAIDLSEAAAIASCVESRDPLVALASPGEVSPVLAAALSTGGNDRVYLFPITARLNTVALVLAAGIVAPAPMELLCEAAGMKLESLEAETRSAVAAAVKPVSDAATPLVQIAGAANGSGKVATVSPVETNTWSRLTPQEQAFHLKAQRTAKVRVAQMRISESDALRKGVQSGDIYGALRTSIDSAREEFQRTYISTSPTMVDYLHLELLRSLAHDDGGLLGQTYPGPIV